MSKIRISVRKAALFIAGETILVIGIMKAVGTDGADEEARILRLLGVAMTMIGTLIVKLASEQAQDKIRDEVIPSLERELENNYQRELENNRNNFFLPPPLPSNNDANLGVHPRSPNNKS